MRTRLDRCHNIADVRRLALPRLPLPVRDFVEGGGEDEVSLRRNVTAFDDIALNPRALIDVTDIDLSTHVLGQDISMPVIIAPTGATGTFHPEAEIAVARAAAEAGTIYTQSTNSTRTIEEVGAAAPGAKMFQLYVFNDRGLSREIIDRARAAGFGALCLTVDVPVMGNRERDVRSGIAPDARMGVRSMLSVLAHPRWLVSNARGRGAVPGNFAKDAPGLPGPLRGVLTGEDAARRMVGKYLTPSMTWADAEEMVRHWNGPFAVKGVMTAADARAAADIGASAVIVSNHGGRQMDGVPATIEALPAIAEAVGGRIEVLLDGGVRRGAHVLKALALGAKAVMIGRPYVYGVTAGGRQGVAKVLAIFRAELTRDCRLLGVPAIAAVGPDLVTRRRGHEAHQG
jgi:L-lactate dehydrogenase (cytochrome)